MSAPCPVFGFEVVFRIVPGLGEAAARALWDDFIAGPIDGRGLVCGGGPSEGRWSHLVSSDAGQATDADREAVATWAAARPEIVAAEVGPLVDLSSAA